MKKCIKCVYCMVLAAVLLLFSGCNTHPAENENSAGSEEPAEINSLPGGERFPVDNGYVDNRTVYTYEDFEYGMIDGQVSILKYTGNEENVVVPNKINGIPVSRLHLFCFKDNKTVVSVKLPESLTDIDISAFQNCTALVSINLPNSIKRIREYAFDNCASLVSADLPKRLEFLGYAAFQGCVSLTSITIPKSIYMDAYPSQFQNTFANCTSLTEVNFEEGATTIGFGGNFKGCTALTSFTFPDGITYIPKNYLEDCTSLTTVTIPGSVEMIGTQAFSNTALTTAVIPSGVAYLGDAFSGCQSLTSLKFEGDVPQKFDSENLLADNPQLTLYYHEEAEGWTSPTFLGFPTQTW